MAVLEAEARAAAPAASWVAVPTPPPPAPPIDRRVALRLAVRDQGHQLRRQGRFVRCTRCQLWRGRLGAFAKVECINRKAIQAPVVQPEPAPPAFEWQHLTPAQRKRKLAALRDADRAAKRQQKLADQQADADETMRIDEHVEESELIVTSEPTEVPYLIHASHRILYHRGFSACIRCGAMASSATKKAEHLAASCLGSSSMSSGTRSRLRRLQRGEHPRAERANGIWPDGGAIGTSSPPPSLTSGLVQVPETGSTRLLLVQPV